MVLAAGGSSRMGEPKQLIQHHGRPLVARATDSALDAGADPVVVVLGAHAGRIRPVLPRSTAVTIVVNSAWESGLASSLVRGLRAALLESSWDAVLLTLADQPLVDSKTLLRLVGELRGGTRLVASEYDGIPGVPALIGREHVPDLLSLTGDVGAGPWLRSRRSDVTVVPLDTASLDLDTRADLARLAGRTGPR